MVLFRAFFHIKGLFFKDPKLNYEGGEVFTYTGLNSVSWSFSYACEILKNLVLDFDLSSVKLWWMKNQGSVEEDLRPFRHNKDATKLAKFINIHKCDVEIYVEYIQIVSTSDELPQGNGNIAIYEEPVVDEKYINDELGSYCEGFYGSLNQTSLLNCDSLGAANVSTKVVFKVGMQFSSLQLFKELVIEHNVSIGREIVFKKNDTERVRVVCKFNKSCKYLVFVSRVGGTSTFRVKTLIPRHRCRRFFDNSNARASWISKKMEKEVKKNPSICLKDVIDYVWSRFRVKIPYWRACSAIKVAREMVDLDFSRQYSCLLSFRDELMRVSGMNTCKVEMVSPLQGLLPKFEKFYVSFDGCKNAFKKACRPFVALESVHLKNNCCGALLVALGRDPNDYSLLFAFVVVQEESKDNWRWFMDILCEDIGDRRLCFMSHKEGGLVEVLEETYGHYERRLCLQCFYSGFKEKFGSQPLFRELIFAAVKCTYYDDWLEKVEAIKELDESAYLWLTGQLTKEWCNHAFSVVSRCDNVVNNLLESFFSSIVIEKDKPIISIVESVRSFLVERFESLVSSFVF